MTVRLVVTAELGVEVLKSSRLSVTRLEEENGSSHRGALDPTSQRVPWHLQTHPLR